MPHHANVARFLEEAACNILDRALLSWLLKNVRGEKTVYIQRSFAELDCDSRRVATLLRGLYTKVPKLEPSSALFNTLPNFQSVRKNLVEFFVHCSRGRWIFRLFFNRCLGYRPFEYRSGISVRQFFKLFPTDEKAEKWFVKDRWPNVTALATFFVPVEQRRWKPHLHEYT